MPDEAPPDATFSQGVGKIEWVTVPSEPIATYAETWQIAMGPAEIKLKIGDNLGAENGVITARHSLTLVFSHSGFVKFVNEMEKSKSFLEDLYEGNVPSFENKASDIPRLLAKHYGVKAEVI